MPNVLRRILLIRHGPSAHSESPGWIDAAGVDRWREAYDAAGNNSGTVNAANVTTSPSCSGVRVYQNSAYGGYGVCLQTGDYNAAAQETFAELDEDGAPQD